MNIPDEFPSAVRWYGNHFLDSLLCIPNDNFYRNIRKGCYAPQMRQGLDKYFYRNGHIIKHKKGDSQVLELRFPNFRIRDFIAPEYSRNFHQLSNDIIITIYSRFDACPMIITTGIFLKGLHTENVARLWQNIPIVIDI